MSTDGLGVVPNASCNVRMEMRISAVERDEEWLIMVKSHEDAERV